MYNSLLFQYFLLLRTVQREYQYIYESRANIYSRFTIHSRLNIFIVSAKRGLFRDMSDFVTYRVIQQIL